MEVGKCQDDDEYKYLEAEQAGDKTQREPERENPPASQEALAHPETSDEHQHVNDEAERSIQDGSESSQTRTGRGCDDRESQQGDEPDDPKYETQSGQDHRD